MDIAIKTDRGNIRTMNQDYIRFEKTNDNEALIVLCDGMGGHNAGDVASRMTCDDIIQQYQCRQPMDNDYEIEAWMKAMINKAHQDVKECSQKSAEYEGMGTTVVLVYIRDGFAYISHVGDSRAYMIDEHLEQLTKDDSLVNILVDTGAISIDDAPHHPQKNILLQAIGVGDILHISFCRVSLENQLMLCSDGLYNSLDDQQMLDILKDKSSLENKVDKLVSEANIYGGNDNISVVLISQERIA